MTLVKWARRLQGRFTVVISPYAKDNYVDHRITDQSSILQFIEENWELAAWAMVPQTRAAGTLSSLFDFNNPRHGKFLLDPQTGQVLSHFN